MNRPKDILDELTKDELMAWVRTKFFHLPKRSEILYLRWETQSAKLMDDYSAHNKALDGIDMAERDRLAKAFNASTDPGERMRLLEKMEPYHRALKAHQASYEVLSKRQVKVDKLYDQIDIERQKERRA